MRRFRTAMENSADMIALIDRASMRYVDVNSTLCRRLGYTRRELLAMGPADIVADLSREELERDYDGLIKDRASPGTLRARYRCKNGEELPFESRRRVFRSGSRWIIAAISRDISEQVAAERRLRDSEARFRSLLELSSDMYWEQDAEFRFTVFSGQSPDWIREGRRRMIGKRRWDQHYFNMGEAEWAAHRATLEAHRSFRELELGRLNEKDEQM